jgi:hypothetical protein
MPHVFTPLFSPLLRISILPISPLIGHADPWADRNRGYDASPSQHLSTYYIGGSASSSTRRQEDARPSRGVESADQIYRSPYCGITIAMDPEHELDGETAKAAKRRSDVVNIN